MTLSVCVLEVQSHRLVLCDIKLTDLSKSEINLTDLSICDMKLTDLSISEIVSDVDYSLIKMFKMIIIIIFVLLTVSILMQDHELIIIV